MAAIDVPWIGEMSSPPRKRRASSPQSNNDPNPTFAAFSPYTDLHSPALSKQRATIIVHQKSPLLTATPPQITRALAYSHPFIGPLNKLFGLISWTDKDPWESFLLVAGFWFVTLYGDFAMRWAGPMLAVSALILGMWIRRYSPTSSTSYSGEKGAKGHKRADSDAMRQHRSLDEIVDDLKLFTARCNILLDPLLRMTEFLSTQTSATSATVKPALTILSFRILLITPVWILMTLPPFYLITTKRVILTIGTIVLTWHSRPARVCRIVLWRSRTVKKVCTIITGLDLETPTAPIVIERTPESTPRKGPKTANEIAASLAAKRGPEAAPGIRFTFTLFENQRRWLGIGWTSSMLAYERNAWTDEHNNAAAPEHRFELPIVEGGMAKWRWVPGSEWRIEGAKEKNGDRGESDEDGWIYYDNKWKDGRRGKDGWGRYTRRRKWLRDAELIELNPSADRTPPHTRNPIELPANTPPLSFETQKDLRLAAAALSETHLPTPSTETSSTPSTQLSRATSTSVQSPKSDDTLVEGEPDRTLRRKPWFRRSSAATATSEKAGSFAGSHVSSNSERSREDEEAADLLASPYLQHKEGESPWEINQDARMGLG